MPQINVPFDLEPWCEACPHLKMSQSVVLYGLDGCRVSMPSCENLPVCKRAVEAAQILGEKGGDADG